MARPWYSTDRFRSSLVQAGIFLGVVVILILSARIPAVRDLYERIEAAGVRLGTSLGGSLRRANQSEDSLAAMYNACEEDLRATAVDKARLSLLEQEVKELRILHNYVEQKNIPGVLGRIVSRSLDQDGALITLDVGQEEGVSSGAAVMIDNGILFGVIIESREHTSVARLLNSPQSKVPGTILGSSRTLGLVEGRQGTLLVMDFIPQEAEIEVNDIVVSTGLDNLLPEGLVIGLISEIVSDDSAPFKQALVEPPYTASDWTTVYVIPGQSL